ncbi:steroid hormone receptor ERR1-like isoform X1 [Penaeus japonicus]|uniref:steroid hormone receptor ERR1-like isoform X1 n=1 Tax=Penaeus japonicus TaxID=27405 RepID=UPI001C70CC49|nr:steroid hormone receptor ERR1-like isoform X1 [Penaeus japonicus]
MDSGDGTSSLDLYGHMGAEGGAGGGAPGVSSTSSPGFLMDSWVHQLYEQVCMMSGGGGPGDGEGVGGVGHIKQEDGGYGVTPTSTHHHPRARQASCSSPNTTAVYSPSTTGITSELDYSECGDEAQPSPKHMKLFTDSPPSPDRQFCSSTTSMASDSAHTPSESLREDDAPKRLCLVCGDIASGFHYGVASCEACKAFFKRTIQGNIEYTCPAANDCEINKRRRKACQACRFHKCLRVGMLKEGVRLDRVRGGRQKYRRTTDSPFSMHQMPVKKASLEDIKLLASLRACEPESLLALPDLTVFDPDYLTISILADLYDRELVSTIGWAKQIPGFTELALNDQMRLLQSTWGEILTLGLAYRSMPAHAHTLLFAHDFTLDEKQARECNATELFTQVLGVVERLEQCNINREEFLLLKALVLTNSDVRLQDNQALHRLRQNILQALHDAVATLRLRDAVAQMQSLLLCLPSLRAADAALRRYWLSVRHQGTVPMNKLFVEMLESHMR